MTQGSLICLGTASGSEARACLPLRLGFAAKANTPSSNKVILAGYYRRSQPKAGYDLSALLAAADAAMYLAKQKGRNQVYCPATADGARAC